MHYHNRAAQGSLKSEQHTLPLHCIHDICYEIKSSPRDLKVTTRSCLSLTQQEVMSVIMESWTLYPNSAVKPSAMTGPGWSINSFALAENPCNSKRQIFYNGHGFIDTFCSIDYSPKGDQIRQANNRRSCHHDVYNNPWLTYSRFKLSLNKMFILRAVSWHSGPKNTT